MNALPTSPDMAPLLSAGLTPGVGDYDGSEDLMAMHEASFDPDKCLYCKVENGHTLVHGAGGRGYGLGAPPITSGCYQWKVGHTVNVLYFALYIFLRIYMSTAKIYPI